MGDPAREVDTGGDSPLLQRGLDRLFQLPIPADEHPEVLPVGEDGGEGLGEVLDAFLPAQSADVADERGPAGQRSGDGEGAEVEEVLVGDEDFVTIMFKVPFFDEAWRVEDDFISKITVDFCEKNNKLGARIRLILHHNFC